MPELLKAETAYNLGRKSEAHYHIAYVNEVTQSGSTTIQDNHSHKITFLPLPVMQGMGDKNPPLWTVEPINGHTHALVPYSGKETNMKETDEEVVEDTAKMFFEVEELEKSSRERGISAEDFYMSKQWDASTKKKLAGEDRAAITINKIEQKMDNLCGYQKQNRTDLKFLPMEGGDQAVSDIITHLAKHITGQCYYEREESKVFEDAAITGRGLFNIYIDFDSNIEGDIVIEKYEWDEGYLGPHRKEDLSDCEVVFKEKWYSDKKLKELYPDKFDKFTEELKLASAGSGVSEDWDKRLRSIEFIDKAAKKYRLIERQMKVFKRVSVLASATDGFTFSAEEWKDTDVNAVRRDIPGFTKIFRISYKLRLTKICSNILVEDEIISDESDFSLVPLYAKKRGDEFWGKIEGVKELNMLINKAYSQFVDIINKVANYGWFWDAETFPEGEKKKWLNNAAKPGFNQQVTDTGKVPIKVEGVRLPTELTSAIAMFNNDIREIMNINLEFMGSESGQQSGVAIKQKIAQQLLGNDFLFDNLSFVKKKIGQILVKKIQKIYTPERIMRILSNRNSNMAAMGENPMMITLPQNQAGQNIPTPTPLSQVSPESIRELLETADLSKYDVIVSESQNSPSAMIGNFLLFIELAGKGVQIPASVILEFAPIPNKDKIMKMIGEDMQRQQDAENKKYATEIQKTMIAKGEPTPPVMQ